MFYIKYFPYRNFSYLLTALITFQLASRIENIDLSATTGFCIGAIYTAGCILSGYLICLIESSRSNKSSSR